MRESHLLLIAVRLLVPLLLVYSIFILWRGHNAPGGGFVGGLIAAAALVLYALTAGIPAGRRVLRVEPSSLLAVGLAVALVSGLPSILLGGAFLTSVWTEIHLGSIEVALGTPLIFDIGVYLAVLGVVLTIFFSLAETSLAEG